MSGPGLLARPLAPLPGGPAIPTTITPAEAVALRELARRRRVIEFGAAYGFSTVTMALVAKHVTSVDLGDDLPILMKNLIAYGVARRVTIIVGSSQVACQGGLGSAGLVFIDADHSYAAALADLQCAASLGAWTIALHDYARLPAVQRAADNWSPAGPSQLVDSLAIYHRQSR
jgi:predicted O-methyltransferase YrrM